MRSSKTVTLMIVACRNIRRNLRRTALCVTAVAIAVFFTIIMQAMVTGMTGSIEEVVRAFDTGDVSVTSEAFEEEREFMPVQYPVAGGESAASLAARLKTIPGVKDVFPRITAYASLEDSTVKNGFLWGIRIEEETARRSFNLTARTNGLLEGRYPGASGNECAVGKSFAEKTGLRVGDEVLLNTVTAHYSDRVWAPVITGIFEFDYLKYDEGAIIVAYDRLEKLLGLEGAAQQLFIFGEKQTQSRGIAREVRELLGPENSVREWRDNYFVVMMRKSMLIYAVVYLVFMVVASFLIVNTVVMIIHERVKEIGMMGSLGMTRPEITGVFFFEALFLSVLGALAGCVAGGLTCFILSFFPLDFNAMTGGGFKDFPISGTLVFAFDWGILAQGFCLGVVIASLCTLLPSMKSAFIDPVEALRR